MFLILDPDLQYHVLTDADPRDDGFTGSVESEVTFLDNDDFEWPDGAVGPDHVLCVSLTDPKSYRVFKYSKDARPSGFRVIGPNYTYATSYAAYLRSRKPMPASALDGWLRDVWTRKGQKLIVEGGHTEVYPSLKRSLMREFIDNELKTNALAGKVWSPLTDHERTIRLLDAFPDDEELVT